MAPTDALSQQNIVDSFQDNEEAAICPNPIVIQALDLSLIHYIQSSSQSDPLVLHAIESLQQESLLFAQSSPKDWQFKDNHLYFKEQIYSLHLLTHPSTIPA